MSDADIGSVTFNENEKLVAPKMKVRPNAAIPITAAIILFLGALITGYSGIFGVFFGAELDDETLYNQFNGTSGAENLTQDDMTLYVEDVEDSTYYKISSYVDLVIAALLATGGYFLFRGERRGIQFGSSGAGLLTLSSAWSAWISHHASSHLPKIVAFTLTGVSFLMVFCGLFCLGAAFLPLMFASGRAALSTQTLIETMAFEEE